MHRLFLVMAGSYLLVALLLAGAALGLTLWAHLVGDEALQKLVSDAITHTVAAAAVPGLIGGFDMFFSIWQMIRNNQLEEERREERRQEREEYRKEREEYRKAWQEESARYRQTQEEERRAWQEESARYRQTQEEERRAWQEERAQRRQAQEEDRAQRRQAQEEDRAQYRRSQEEERAAHRQAQAEILAELRAERAQREVLTARVLELSEQMVNRANGKSNDNGNGNA